MTQHRIATVASEQLISPISLQHDLDVSPQVLTHEKEWNVGSVGEGLIMGLNQPCQN